MLMREGFRFSRLVKFPTVALAFVFGKPKPKTLEWASYVVCMHLFIEGEHKGYRDFLVKKNLALLCDLRFFFGLEWEDAGVGMGNDWKTIQVYCETELTVCSWGVCVYKHETNIEDIQITSEVPSSTLVRSLHALKVKYKN